MAKWDFDKIDAEKAKLIEERDKYQRALWQCELDLQLTKAELAAAEAKLAQAVELLEAIETEYYDLPWGPVLFSVAQVDAFLSTIQPEGETDDKA